MRQRRVRMWFSCTCTFNHDVMRMLVLIQVLERRVRGHDGRVKVLLTTQEEWG